MRSLLALIIWLFTIPAIAAPDKAAQAFCEVTAYAAMSAYQMRHDGKSLDYVLTSAEETKAELMEAFMVTERQWGAITRAIRYAYSVSPNEDIELLGQYQYVGCLFTEV